LRYFKDITALKRFACSILNKRETGEISSQDYRDLFYGINVTLKIMIQIWHEKELIPIQKRLDLLEETDGEI
jgi:hypothetical protein